MTIFFAGIGAVALFLLGLAFRASPSIAILVQILWLLAFLTLIVVVFMWIRSLRKQIQGLGGNFPLSIKEFTNVESDLKALFQRIKYMELEKWDQAAKQAGDSLVLMFSSTIDELTGVANRRRLEAYLTETADKSIPLSIIMMDIDYFKKVNDTYGHGVGDEVLRHFARVVQKAIRPDDFLARYGGEEFIVVCKASIEQAAQVAERIRKSIEKSQAKTAAGEIKITASLGIAEFREGDTPGIVKERADQALYKAKNGGRNKVEKDGD
ncbi:diguanylate cyclase (GGDEF) domain-containing protein [Desulfotomaculum arcticum]|uniref:Diguanylate cyclase (GGDEF) domain-containing protein n=1 Tax=Desulfotruncus arcticus DSM 17038 TaxID=1121424 RepID=A0A1I2Z801_9FIRM|nr:GGDEF domain-containing protein [Desulfotruncus arcticus]SFH33977.1 diguanylate cyclase (GGDEF) domain-containing protein [Desulfotomaculum arcticum] [Desulfotruncus arcticus DSM 17038]